MKANVFELVRHVVDKSKKNFTKCINRHHRQMLFFKKYVYKRRPRSIPPIVFRSNYETYCTSYQISAESDNQFHTRAHITNTHKIRKSKNTQTYTKVEHGLNKRSNCFITGRKQLMAKPKLTVEQNSVTGWLCRLSRFDNLNDQRRHATAPQDP